MAQKRRKSIQEGRNEFLKNNLPFDELREKLKNFNSNSVSPNYIDLLSVDSGKKTLVDFNEKGDAISFISDIDDDVKRLKRPFDFINYLKNSPNFLARAEDLFWLFKIKHDDLGDKTEPFEYPDNTRDGNYWDEKFIDLDDGGEFSRKIRQSNLDSKYDQHGSLGETTSRKTNLSELEEEALRKAIRELMLGDKIQREHDALFAKKQDWKDETKSLRADMTQLLKHIEDDQYQEGIEAIDRVRGKLKTWKGKIQKFLN